MKKMFLLVLFTLLFSSDLVFSQTDTVWVTNRDCSTDNIVVSPDERFVVAWGAHGWTDDNDPDQSWNLYGDPAKVFDAQTGEWLTTIYDSVNTGSQKNWVEYVSFSPDSSKMLVSFGAGIGILIIDLNNNFNVIDTIHYGYSAIYSDDMSMIATTANYGVNIFDGNTYEKVAEFDWKAKIVHYETGNPTVSGSVLPGIFRKNGREYVFPYKWSTNTMPNPSRGNGLCVIDLVDSTCTLNPDMVPFVKMYHRHNTNYYSAVEKMEDSITCVIRNQETDEIVWASTRYQDNYLPQITADGEHFLYYGNFYNFTDTNSICSLFPGVGGDLGNDYLYARESPNYRIMATRTCTYLGVPPPITMQEIKTYPVPTNGMLNIEMELLGGEYKAEIVDILGRRLTELSLGYLPNGQQTIYLEVEELPSGIYQAILRSQSEVRAVKFVKE